MIGPIRKADADLLLSLACSESTKSRRVAVKTPVNKRQATEVKMGGLFHTLVSAQRKTASDKGTLPRKASGNVKELMELHAKKV